MRTVHTRLPYLRELLRAKSNEYLQRFIADESTRRLFEDFEKSLLDAWQASGHGTLGQDWTPMKMTDFKRETSHPRPVQLDLAGSSEPAQSPVASTQSSVATPASPAVAVPPGLGPGSGPTPAHQTDFITSDTERTAVPVPATELVQNRSPVSHAPNLDGVAKPAANGLTPPLPGGQPKLAHVPAAAFRLPNGRQGESYAAVFEVEPSNLRVAVFDALVPDGLGLRFNRSSSRIDGMPVQHGEFKIPLRYRFGSDSPEAQRTGTATLYINPDPKALWKDIPSDRSQAMWKEDQARDLMEGDARRIVAARKRGRSHAHVGTCCDDDYWIGIEDGWYVAIVADGAGSAKASRRGSLVAVRAAGAHLRETLPLEAGAELLDAAEAFIADGNDQNRRLLHNHLYVSVGYAAHKALKAIHDEVPRWPGVVAGAKDLATTLLVGIARQIAGKWLCAAYWVGDGAVGVYRKGKEVHLLGEVDAGEFSGQTKFLDQNEVTQEALLNRTRFAVVEDFTAFVLMTDGVSDPKFETEARLAGVEGWDALWAELEGACALSERGEHTDQRLVEWLDFWSQGNHDDRTIALIY